MARRAAWRVGWRPAARPGPPLATLRRTPTLVNHGIGSPISPSPSQSLPTRVDAKIGSRLRMCTRSISHASCSGSGFVSRK